MGVAMDEAVESGAPLFAAGHQKASVAAGSGSTRILMAADPIAQDYPSNERGAGGVLQTGLL